MSDQRKTKESKGQGQPKKESKEFKKGPRKEPIKEHKKESKNEPKKEPTKEHKKESKKEPKESSKKEPAKRKTLSLLDGAALFLAGDLSPEQDRAWTAALRKKYTPAWEYPFYEMMGKKARERYEARMAAEGIYRVRPGGGKPGSGAKPGPRASEPGSGANPAPRASGSGSSGGTSAGASGGKASSSGSLRPEDSASQVAARGSRRSHHTSSSSRRSGG
ncbi:hypothetical protein CDD83_9664 [Cordyceps sp. RAO-2017]|nr:hypothetical protein CDD83_9664 [Cordyceps sp. RAO-2017]